MIDEAGLRHTSAAELKAQLQAERLGLPFLVYRDDAGQQRIHTLSAATTRITLGRAPENDVPLAWDAHVSRVHAELELVGGDWIVNDDGLSRNGTWVNGDKLLRRRRLDDGDVVRVGATHVRFRLPVRLDLGTTAIDSSLPPEARLSPAQRRVLVALCRPLSSGEAGATPATNPQIAAELFLSIDAVKTHLRSLYPKFAVEDFAQNQKRSALAARALASGAVSLEELRA
ncbi:MAG TPA: FHA domain-containing protein [Baekduia sp.]|nr:FHA domain-containing protein [Baekduia sp.]